MAPGRIMRSATNRNQSINQSIERVVRGPLRRLPESPPSLRISPKAGKTQVFLQKMRLLGF